MEESLARLKRNRAERSQDQQPTAAARVEEAIREWRQQNELDFQKQRLIEQVVPHAAAFLRTPVPQERTVAQYFRWDTVFGETHQKLRKSIDESAFHPDTQQRSLLPLFRRTAEARHTAVHLSEFFLTLMWRTSQEYPLVKAVESAQCLLLNGLSEQPSFSQVQNFSDSCVLCTWRFLHTFSSSTMSR